MNRKNAVRPLIIVLVLAVLFTWYRMRPAVRSIPQQNSTVTGPATHQQVISADAQLVYTHHARCRMDCRHITETEVREVLTEGHINEAKSNPSDTPCPTYAIEDNTREGQHLRIVFAPCNDVVKVITCIDLDEEFTCHCN